MQKRAIGLFVIFSPFTAYFAISPWLRLPVMLILFVYIIFLIKIVLQKKISRNFIFGINTVDILLLLLLISIMISLSFNGINSKGVNHVFAYTFTFLILFIGLKKIIDFEGIGYFFILKMLAITSLLCGVIIISDWILVNFLSIGFREYFVKVDNRIANMLYYSKGYFISVGGVAEEPGSMALLLNIISPLGLLYWKLREKYVYFLLSLGIYLLSLFFLFSVTGLVSVSCSVAFLALLKLAGKGARWRAKRGIFILTCCFLFSCAVIGTLYAIRNRDLLVQQMQEIKAKILLNDQDVSANARTETWQNALNDWRRSPIWGNGPGNSMKLYDTGYHSVYLTLLADTGVVSLTLFLLFVLMQFREVLLVGGKYRSYLFIALFSSLIHFAVVGDFYHVQFWIMLICIHLIRKSTYSAG